MFDLVWSIRIVPSTACATCPGLGRCAPAMATEIHPARVTCCVDLVDPGSTHLTPAREFLTGTAGSTGRV